MRRLAFFLYRRFGSNTQAAARILLVTSGQFHSKRVHTRTYKHTQREDVLLCCSNCTKNKKYLPACIITWPACIITWPACIITWLVCITELWSLLCMNNCCWVLQMAYHAWLIFRLCLCILQLSHILCKYFDFGKAPDPSVHGNPLLPRGYQGCMLWHNVLNLKNSNTLEQTTDTAGMLSSALATVWVHVLKIFKQTWFASLLPVGYLNQHMIFSLLGHLLIVTYCVFKYLYFI